ncbi:VOC family protein [Haloferula sargassicola]|uniref:VOC domain-containing protein n=1 Tax=Haloferula sargassicola TaxID=490096 RepID=A0ABP9ULI6_9BACT
MSEQRNPVGWFEIYVRDMEQARKFYAEVLAVELEKLETPPGMEMEMWNFPMFQDAGGAAGALVKMEGVEPGGGGTLVYFSCEDCAVEAGRVEPAGGKVVREKFPIGNYGFIALVVDPDGNMIGLHSLS